MGKVSELRASGKASCVSEAEMELLQARSILEVLNDLYSQGDDALKESVTDHMCGTIYSILNHVRAAQDALEAYCEG
jgi:hypothetical protein